MRAIFEINAFRGFLKKNDEISLLEKVQRNFPNFSITVLNFVDLPLVLVGTSCSSVWPIFRQRATSYKESSFPLISSMEANKAISQAQSFYKLKSVQYSFGELLKAHSQ